MESGHFLKEFDSTITLIVKSDWEERPKRRIFCEFSFYYIHNFNLRWRGSTSGSKRSNSSLYVLTIF